MRVYHTFTVKGRGHFPFDMLRYDSCFPEAQVDVSNVSHPSMNEDREICLGTFQHKGWEPTIGRWDSFLWKVTSHKQHS